MDVSPETIRTVEFRERLRGYNQDDVDQFLERMAAGVEILQQRLRDASQRAARAEERPQGDGEDALRRTLALAQRTADLAVEEGREQAARLVQSAQGEAHSVVAAAQGEAEAVLADAEQRATRLIEDAQAQVAAQVHRLEGRREQLEGELVALERHVAQARARAYASLADAARQIEHLVPAPAPEPTPGSLTHSAIEPLIGSTSASMTAAVEGGGQGADPGIDAEPGISAQPGSDDQPGITEVGAIQPSVPPGPQDSPAEVQHRAPEEQGREPELPVAASEGSTDPVPFEGASMQS
jgi:cell division initiation protein